MARQVGGLKTREEKERDRGVGERKRERQREGGEERKRVKSVVCSSGQKVIKSARGCQVICNKPKLKMT